MRKQLDVTRRRPRLNTTVANTTLTTLENVRVEIGLPTVGVAADYIVTDWKRMKHAASEQTQIEAVA